MLSFPLSQTFAWGRAIRAVSGNPFIVFSPERKVSALFILSGNDAECVNGPVLDWSGIQTSRDLNEKLSMVVYALHQCHPELQSVTLRPRLSESQCQFLTEQSAFPIDQIDRSQTMILDLESTESKQWMRLPGRIRNEVERARRAGVLVSTRSAKEGLSSFWKATVRFYQERGLFIPNEAWIQAFISSDSSLEVESTLIAATHEASQSESELLLIEAQGTGYYFFAHERRGKDCPKVSLNGYAQWEAMKKCIRSGNLHYDLNGVLHPDHREEVDSGYRGVDFYKRKFKGREVSYLNPLIRFG